MHLKTRNVNTAFRELVYGFDAGAAGMKTDPKAFDIVKEPSRNGNVLRIAEPVTITYSHPRERVLFNAARDANPFFHLYEALWMLAGRNDVAPVAYYAKQMAEYSDDGKTLNGAYGYRWRQYPVDRGHAVTGDELINRTDRTNPGDPTNPYKLYKRVDQLDVIINHLKADPTSRRAVLQMWNVEDDLLKTGSVCPRCKGDGRFNGVFAEAADPKALDPCPQCSGSGKIASKDVCCNLSVMFSLRTGRLVDQPLTDVGEATISGPFLTRGKLPSYLDMTVTNRSNDMVWGMLGANYVHFSFLQEYLAARLGAEVGIYHHFTNNLHVYDWNWKPDEWLTDQTDANWRANPTHWPSTVPLVSSLETFEKELPRFVEEFKGLPGPEAVLAETWTEPFLRDVCRPAFCAFAYYKVGSWKNAPGGSRWHELIKADDWRIACTEWLNRRKK